MKLEKTLQNLAEKRNNSRGSGKTQNYYKSFKFNQIQE